MHVDGLPLDRRRFADVLAIGPTLHDHVSRLRLIEVYQHERGRIVLKRFDQRGHVFGQAGPTPGRVKIAQPGVKDLTLVLGSKPTERKLDEGVHGRRRGQAGGSSKIENFIGFPSGLSGAELAMLSVLQMLKFLLTKKQRLDFSSGWADSSDDLLEHDLDADSMDSDFLTQLINETDDGIDAVSTQSQPQYRNQNRRGGHW